MIRDPPATDALRSVRVPTRRLRAAIDPVVAVGVRSTDFLKRRTVDRLQRRLTALYDGFDRGESTPSVLDSSGVDRASAARSSLPKPTTRSEILDHGFTPAEYVRRVLREHGGQMRQRQFTDDYGWSPATSSRLLSKLESEGDVVRYRRGREKVVCLPETFSGTDRR